MSLFHHLPAEVIRLICHRLPLEDVVSFVESDSHLDRIVQNTLFRDIKRLEVGWNSKGATLTFSGQSLWQPMSIQTTSNFWEDVIVRAIHLKEIVVTKAEDAKDYTVLDALCKQNYRIRRLDIKLRPGKRTVSQNTTANSYQRLTVFVTHFRRGLSTLRLETDEKNSVEVNCDGSSAVCHFSHQYDSSLCNRLITPIFNRMLSDRANLTGVTLRVDWGEKAGLILQSAIHAALPFEHRSRVRTLRLEIGSGVSSEHSPEIQGVLSEYAPYLNSFIRLQHFICDLRNSTLDPTDLENLYTTMSNELSNQGHRISLLTSAIPCR